jgi:hypothetical protein
LTKVDGQVSENRANIIFRFWNVLTMQEQPFKLAGGPLETVRRGVQQQWLQTTGPIAQLTTIIVLQAVDETFRTTYCEQAKSLFLRLASLLTNADGAASVESQSVFHEFENLLAPTGTSASET